MSEDNNSLAPVKKVAAAGIAGAITVILVFVVNLVFPEIVIPPEVSAAITAILAFGAGYFTES